MTLPIDPADILLAVSREFSVDPYKIRGPARQKRYTEPRFMAYALFRSLSTSADGSQAPLEAIGSFFTGRDHTSILYGLKRHKARMESPEYRERYENILLSLNPESIVDARNAVFRSCRA